MPLPSRENETDVAYALEASRYVVGAYALNLPPSAIDHPDALPFGVPGSGARELDGSLPKTPCPRHRFRVQI
jgi:hypothetical protein